MEVTLLEVLAGKGQKQHEDDYGNPEHCGYKGDSRFMQQLSASTFVRWFCWGSPAIASVEHRVHYQRVEVHYGHDGELYQHVVDRQVPYLPCPKHGCTSEQELFLRNYSLFAVWIESFKDPPS